MFALCYCDCAVVCLLFYACWVAIRCSFGFVLVCLCCASVVLFVVIDGLFVVVFIAWI